MGCITGFTLASMIAETVFIFSMEELLIAMTLVPLFVVSLFFIGGFFLLLFPILLLLDILFVMKELPFRWLALPWAMVALHTHTLTMLVAGD